jgi:hypothetical protein
MFGQYLSNTNERAMVLILPKNLELSPCLDAAKIFGEMSTFGRMDLNRGL